MPIAFNLKKPQIIGPNGEIRNRRGTQIENPPNKQENGWKDQRSKVELVKSGKRREGVIEIVEFRRNTETKIGGIGLAGKRQQPRKWEMRERWAFSTRRRKG
ncbi:hypothetical protein V8G54_011252, partial [Vigna mungo]